LEVITAIRTNDPTLKGREESFFKEEDFNMPKSDDDVANKPFTLKD
jgi:hypothetical protein